jgi:O-antigen/teichoic acid export membrane protein
MKTKINKIFSFASGKLNINFRSLFRNSFWIMTENGISLVLGMLVVYAMGNFIDPSVAGEYKYIISLAAIVASFTISGVTYAVIRETSMGYDSFFHFATNKSLKWSLSPVLIAFVISAYYFWQGNSVYAIAFFIATFFTIMISNFSLYRSYLTGKENFQKMAIYGNIVLFVTSLLSLATFYFFDNLLLLMLGTLGTQFLTLLVIYYLVRKGIPHTSLDQELVDKFNRYVYSQSFINIISIAATQMDKIILFQFLGPVDLAAYTFVTVLSEKIRGLLKSFSSLIFPKFVKRDVETIKDKMFKESILFFVFLTFCFLGTLLVTPFLYAWFLPKYTTYIYLAMIYSLSIFSILGQVPYTAIQAKNYKKDLYTYELSNSVLQVVCVAVGIYFAGLLGAVVGKIVASFVGIAVLYGLLFKELFFRSN